MPLQLGHGDTSFLFQRCAAADNANDMGILGIQLLKPILAGMVQARCRAGGLCRCCSSAVQPAVCDPTVPATCPTPLQWRPSRRKHRQMFCSRLYYLNISGIIFTMWHILFSVPLEDNQSGPQKMEQCQWRSAGGSHPPPCFQSSAARSRFTHLWWTRSRRKLNSQQLFYFECSWRTQFGLSFYKNMNLSLNRRS